MVTANSLQKVIDAARSLPINDKLQLLQSIVLDLQQMDQLEVLQDSFWEKQSIDKLLQEQSIPIITNVQSLTVDFWEEDESIDEFEQFVVDSRQTDRMDCSNRYSS
ncbi:hypothetical protein [Cuspidothrix issatschenkoi]|uniref:Uncharacterized protein n=1 Tax=Cuspidothrix issatschenkoi CHARLIE-1 TaxID=2052836 RepID=A0A2S6CS79_9CYAN|nr:hypothetical protein [Cuspidothrix issatschenkoi]PPJ62559.1 hypothetical protein CUN59_15005 [Cuspidothrix issatschenkoi CHARLIE-1]